MFNLCCSALLLLLYFRHTNCGDPLNITARLGQNVTLPCRAPSRSPIRAAEWSRPDLEPQYVFFYRDKQPDKTQQHPFFQNRVELADSEINDGNLSLILKSVIRSDAGTYECRVKQGGRRRRAVIKTEPISIVYLDVTEPRQTAGSSGDGQHTDGHVGLSLMAAVCSWTFTLYET